MFKEGLLLEVDGVLELLLGFQDPVPDRRCLVNVRGIPIGHPVQGFRDRTVFPDLCPPDTLPLGQFSFFDLKNDIQYMSKSGL